MPKPIISSIYLGGLVFFLVACLPASTSEPVVPLPESSNQPTQSTDITLLPESRPTRTPSVTPSPESLLEATMEPATRPGTADADVIFVRAVQAENGTWTFNVTVSHPDTGWEDYADGWDVVTPQGEVLKTNPDSPFTRLLLHPHVEEQPFTRSQSGVEIPPGITSIVVRAHDLVSGFGGRVVQVDLTAESGPDFEVVLYDDG